MNLNQIHDYVKVFNSLIQNDQELSNDNYFIGIAPSTIQLMELNKLIDKRVHVIAQHVNYEPKGAFTGLVSYSQIKDCGVNYAIIGHSETRKLLNLSDEDINKTINSFLNNQITPILCVGEPLAVYQNKQSAQFVNKQIENALKGFDPNQLTNLIIAYEPIWAIGQHSASNDFINEISSSIRELLVNKYSEVGNKIRVLYGGSVKSSNSRDILSIKNIDGVLVGGAGLDPQEFYKIIKSK